MFKRKFITLVLLTLASIGAHAQYDASFSHYFDMEPTFNAASVGKQSKLNITAAYAMDLVGFENNPQTMYAAADLPFYFLKGLHGAGVQFMNDRLGLFSHQRLALQYAYKHKLFGGTISAGVSVGLLSESFDGTKLDAGEAGDPALPSTKVEGSGFDLGAGLYYMHGPWYVGVSAQHLNAPLVELGETNELQIDPTYYLTGGYNIKLRNPLITIHPAVLCMYDGSDFRANISGRVELHDDNKKLFAGATYSPQHSAAAFVGGLFHGITVSYSYEAYTSMPDLKSGAHEIVLQYRLDMNLYKKGRNRHKSVRYL